MSWYYFSCWFFSFLFMLWWCLSKPLYNCWSFKKKSLLQIKRILLLLEWSKTLEQNPTRCSVKLSVNCAVVFHSLYYQSLHLWEVYNVYDYSKGQQYICCLHVYQTSMNVWLLAGWLKTRIIHYIYRWWKRICIEQQIFVISSYLFVYF